MNKSIAGRLILKSPCLSLLEICRNMVELKQIHAQIFRTGLSQDYLALTTILKICALSNSPKFDYARHVFDQIEIPNTFAWNSLIRAYSKNIINANNVIALYKEMLHKGAKPNGVTLSFVSKACSNLKILPVLMGIHAKIFELDFSSDVFVLNSLIHAYSVCGSIDSARRVFDEIPKRDLISWTILISGYVRSNRAKEAIHLFFLMREENVRPDEVTVVAIFTACSRLGDLTFAKKLERLVHEIGVEYNAYVSNSLIDLYAKCGSIGDARNQFDKMLDKNIISWNTMVAGYGRSGNMEAAKRLFNRIPEKNEVSWSALLNGYVQNGAFKEGLMVFRKMQAEGVRPNDAAITGVIAACANLGALEFGKEIHTSLDDRKVLSDVVLSTALIDMYVKCGCLEISLDLFNRIENKNLVSWNVMIMGLSIHGKASDCFDVFSEMVTDGVRPNSITFVGILSGCAHAGLLKEGKEYFNQMSSVYGISPQPEHCSCIVRLLGQAGFLDEALNFINSSPVKPDVVIWGALLSACTIHGNVELGELVAKEILKLDPCHGGACVLLSNLYAAANKWGEVMEVRKIMKNRGIDNRPGWSCIEIEGTVHEFLVGDNLHPRIREIFSVLGELDFQMVSQNRVVKEFID